MTDGPVSAQPRLGPELIPVLAAFPDELGRMLQGYSVEALKRPASDGGWGVIENLGHLRDWEEIFLSRVETLIAEDDPRLPVFDDQLWEIEHDYRGQDPHKILDRLRNQRQQLVDVLVALPPAAWSRYGRVGAEDKVTLDTIVQRIRHHDGEHARAIAEALA
ncbi:MAG: DinB family protein [Chloroflexota bacterium]|nr:DinB family protein [Chloroflexota bacterium]